MDIQTGETYKDRAEAEKALRGKGVPDEEIKQRIVTGSKRSLRRLHKKIEKMRGR